MSVSVEVLGRPEVGRRCRHTPTQWYGFPVLLHRMLPTYTCNIITHTHTHIHSTQNNRSTHDAYCRVKLSDFP